MKLVTNTEVNKEDWTDILKKSKYSSPFHTAEFYDFFNSQSNISAQVFAIEENGVYKSLAVVTIYSEQGIKGFFSRRGIIYGGPLLTDDSEGYLTPLIEGIKNHLSKELIYLEIRNYFDYSMFKKPYSELGFKYIPWLNFNLTVESIEIMKKKMSNSRLRQIKKAIKNGVIWKEAKAKDDIKAFYEILKELYKRKVKKPLMPFEFFLDFFKQDIGKYLLVYHNEKVIGGIMCPLMPNKTIYEFYVCGLDNEYRDFYPSVMATWAAMEYACENNLSNFDFMGAGKPDEDYGVREFKSRFGGDQVEYGRFINIFKPTLYKFGSFGLKMLTKLKK